MSTTAWKKFSENDSSNSLDKLLNQMDNDKETQEILTKLVPDGVKLK